MVFSRRSSARFCLVTCFSCAPASRFCTSRILSRSALRPSSRCCLSSFAGWTAIAPTKTGTAPESADQANADVLKEYGLKDFAVGEYSQGGNHLTLHARRFVDATGAYGAFTFYRRLGMHAEDIGKGAAIGGNEALFWTETTLVDAVFGNARCEFRQRGAHPSLRARRAYPSPRPELR